jgi:hypothetical protein
VKALRKQAEKAEEAAARAVDHEHAERMRTLADAFRGQADAMKASRKMPKRKARKSGK